MLKWLLTFIRERRSKPDNSNPTDSGTKRTFEQVYGLRLHQASEKSNQNSDNTQRTSKPVPEAQPRRTKMEDYRNRFRTAPIGNWSQAVGTFGAVMDEHWEFRADGTGRVVETGPFGGERGETLFEWKPVSDFCISCLITKRPWDDEDEGEVEDEPEEWETIRYDFRVVSSDCGNTIALFEVDEKGVPFEGFWLSSTPLSRS